MTLTDAKYDMDIYSIVIHDEIGHTILDAQDNSTGTKLRFRITRDELKGLADFIYKYLENN